MTCHDPTPTIFSLLPVSVDDIELFPLAPKSEEVLRITLAVRIDLENKRNIPAAGFAVADEAALSVTHVGLVENLEAGSELVTEACKDLCSAIGRAIIDGQEDKILRPVLNLVKPLENDFADGRLLVEDRHNDHEFNS
jgi:hypothetical protein